MGFRAEGRGFSYRLSGGRASVRVVSYCILPGLLPLILLVQTSAVENKVCGEPGDSEALRKVRTICIDTSNLDSAAAADVKTFMSGENQPNQMLDRLDWEFADRCAIADAVIRVYFVPSERLVTQPAPNSGIGVGASSFGSYEPATRVVLLIYDRASVRLLYRTEVLVPEENRIVQLKAPFTRLVKDLKRTGR